MDFRTMEEALDIPKSTQHDYFAAGIIVHKHSSLKPLLTPENMQARKQYALAFTNVVSGSVVFDAMMDRTAVARPRVVDGIQFDGILGIWPFVEQIAAKQRSHRQPPNSPDLNILDLGFINPIQTLQQKMPAYTVDELISNVNVAYLNVPDESLDNVFFTLQTVLECILETDGNNKFKLKHIGK
ncbi:hypothetical protein H257_14803 [Aphanomyces astaci]|uniref:Uncharacterized protein n=1 Tax=Aphanomyces astaci TaxID=112090 RepID=W4FQ22_APHAT|nr:hypothetical protein H257_14803 [Aphanomyces astaci]ETV69567.1 hypothetical protein H257_14803 [Aphanomyces astaci]|eukprot:XP_009840991.1 hypothetical protein H257_14803 [Aphanomyces astaci]